MSGTIISVTVNNVSIAEEETFIALSEILHELMELPHEDWVIELKKEYSKLFNYIIEHRGLPKQQLQKLLRPFELKFNYLKRIKKLEDHIRSTNSAELRAEIEKAFDTLKADCQKIKNKEQLEELVDNFNKQVVSAEIDNKVYMKINKKFTEIKGNARHSGNPLLKEICVQIEALKAANNSDKSKLTFDIMKNIRLLENPPVEQNTTSAIDEFKNEVSKTIRDMIDIAAEVDAALSDVLKESQSKINSCSDKFRINLLFDEAKLRYRKAKEQHVSSQLYRQNLSELADKYDIKTLDVSLKNQIDALISQENIKDNEYTCAYENITKRYKQEQQNRRAAAIKEVESAQIKQTASIIKKSLEEMGYSLIEENPQSLTENEVALFESPYKGYDIMARITSDGTVMTRLVRRVGSEGEKTEVMADQKQRDIEITKKWCSQHNNILEALKNHGIPTSVKARIEAGEEDLLVIVDKQLSKGAKKLTQSKHNVNQRQL